MSPTPAQIAFGDIRIGDTVERHYNGIAARGVVFDKALGKVFTAEGGYLHDVPGMPWTLVDRPFDPIEAYALSTEPTTGTLRWVAGNNTPEPGGERAVFAKWRLVEGAQPYAGSDRRTQMHAEEVGLYVPLRHIVGFEAGRVVGNDDLRKVRALWPWGGAHQAVENLLTKAGL